MNTNMNLQKLNPWNWFKHEEPSSGSKTQIPVKRSELPPTPTAFDSPLSELHRNIDRLFDDAFKSFGAPGQELSQFMNWPSETDFKPSLNLVSEDEKYVLTLEAPGMTQDDLSIEVKDDVLMIKGNKVEEKEDKDKHFYRMERRFGSFQRVLALPSDVQVNDIQASMKNGVLSVNIPRNPQVDTDAKKIPISH